MVYWALQSGILLFCASKCEHLFLFLFCIGLQTELSDPVLFLFAGPVAVMLILQGTWDPD